MWSFFIRFPFLFYSHSICPTKFDKINEEKKKICAKRFVWKTIYISTKRHKQSFVSTIQLDDVNKLNLFASSCLCVWCLASMRCDAIKNNKMKTSKKRTMKKKKKKWYSCQNIPIVHLGDKQFQFQTFLWSWIFWLEL